MFKMIFKYIPKIFFYISKLVFIYFPCLKAKNSLSSLNYKKKEERVQNKTPNPQIVSGCAYSFGKRDQMLKPFTQIKIHAHTKEDLLQFYLYGSINQIIL